MHTPQLALLSLLVGLILGIAGAMVTVAAYRARDRAREEVSPRLSDSAAAMLAALDEPAVVVDASVTVVASSPAAAVFGITDGASVPIPELRALARGARSGTASDGGVTLTLRRTVPPVEERTVTVIAREITPRLVLLLMRDITAIERMEQMRRDFVANTSHELKTPVASISLLTEAIQAAADDADQVRSFGARLQTETDRLVALTDRVMNLSRLQGVDEAMRITDVSIDEVVAAAVANNSVTADAADVRLVVGGATGLRVPGDARVLVDAVGNLVSNAVAHSPAGSSVGIGVKDADTAVEITVTDRGEGIAPADQERIFERFYRSDQARSRRTGGTGLGLSIVKHAVQRHGGEVRLWSKPGRGATFTIRLPRVAPVAKKPKQAKKTKKPKPERTTLGE
ncbi:histidine kinase [Microbacterium mangrovi]|uniref:Sensor-like histidine kinase SenX3 n=1 Tax=Microbacterium mangrovi TaxID=1348253 RepID=A0A0B2AAN0_9MICO|nr:ATP-binding protein [Microbacterium mangrovi]KHK98642.1 histidine kinase [Microbacterium mangrovi]